MIRKEGRLAMVFNLSFTPSVSDTSLSSFLVSSHHTICYSSSLVLKLLGLVVFYVESEVFFSLTDFLNNRQASGLLELEFYFAPPSYPFQFSPLQSFKIWNISFSLDFMIVVSSMRDFSCGI